MTSHIVLLTEENSDAFLPCIMPEIHGRLAEPTVFGFGIVAGELDDPEEPAGAIVCEYDTGVATMLSVGVLPRFQRRGLGSRLVQYMAEACARQRFMELDAGCWSTKDGNSPIELFFADNDFESMQGEKVRYAVTLSDLAGSQLEKHLTHPPRNVSATLFPLLEVPPSYMVQFMKDFELPISVLDNLDLRLSYAAVRDGRMTGAALLSERQTGTIEVIYLCSKTSDGRTAAAVLFAAMGELYRTMPADTVVLFTPESELVTRLAERLLEGCKTEQLHRCHLYRSLLPLWPSTTDSEQSHDDLKGA